jgi:hypothetical protein
MSVRQQTGASEPHGDGHASRPIFRVSFSGPDVPNAAVSALETVNMRWEGSESRSDGTPDHHRALVGAATEHDAIGVMRKALGPHGAFSDFRAAPVRNGRGEVVRTPIRKGWWEVDWNEVERKAALSEFERALISTFLDAAEPTWLILGELDMSGERERVEATLRDLERRGLVSRTWEPAGGPEDFGVLETWRGRPERMCDWWALTDEAWDLLGLIKSPRYH